MLAAMLVVLGLVQPGRADAIRLQERSAVRQAEVFLRDVARLEGPAAMAWGDMVVGQVTEQGRTLELTLESVRKKLQLAGANWAKVNLGGYARCQVTRVGAEKPTAAMAETGAAKLDVAGAGETIRPQVLDVLARLAQAPLVDLRISFSVQDEKTLAFTLGADRLECEPRSATGLGKIPLVLRRWRGQRVIETWRVTAEVARRYPALMTVKAVERGQRLAADEVECREIWLSQARELPLSDPAQAVGHDANVSLPAGATLFPDNVRSAVLVKRGELMSVRCVLGALVVKTAGRAGEDAAMDQVIEVRGENARESYRVRVTGPREGLLVYGGQARTDGGSQ